MKNFEERATTLLKNGVAQIHKSEELRAELFYLCEYLGKSLDKQFKSGCRNCINDGITILQIEIKNINNQKKTNMKYIIKNRKVIIKGKTFHLHIMNEDQMTEALKNCPELSKYVILNEREPLKKPVENNDAKKSVEPQINANVSKKEAPKK